MAGVHTIDKLPAKDRERVIEALIETHNSGKEPDYRGLIAKLKLKCSHISLWRYDTKRVKPTIKRNLDVILQANHPNLDIDQGDSSLAKAEALGLAQDETKQRLVDDPIVQAVIAKRRRLDQAIEKTHATEQYDVYAKLESVDLKALEMHARAIQHPGFTSAAPQQAGATTVVVIMPTAAEMQARRSRVIDVVGE